MGLPFLDRKARCHLEAEGLFTLCHPSRKVIAQTPLESEGRSPFIYIMSVFLSNFEYFAEKSLASRLEFGFPFLVCPNSC